MESSQVLSKKTQEQLFYRGNRIICIWRAYIWIIHEQSGEVFLITLRPYIIVTLFFILLCSQGIAYVPIETHEGIRWKFYIETDKQKCFEILSNIDDEYKQDLNVIKVETDSMHWGGMYWYWQKNIELFGGCNKDVIIHELAHHCQYQRGDYYRLAREHRGLFDECEDEIWESYH